MASVYCCGLNPIKLDGKGEVSCGDSWGIKPEKPLRSEVSVKPLICTGGELCGLTGGMPNTADDSRRLELGLSLKKELRKDAPVKSMVWKPTALGFVTEDGDVETTV